MFSKVKVGLLFAALLFISGCSDSLIIQFKHDIDLHEKAEREIAEALQGIAVVDAFTWHQKVDTVIDAPMKLTVEFNANEANPSYSVGQVKQRLMEHFIYQEPDVAAKILITEDKKEALEQTGYVNGHEMIVPMDWNRARVGVYYYEKKKKNFSVDREFFCAIVAPLKTSIPNLSYS
ncbi:hypothetical protein L4C36_23680, partial [Photobacterium japonica]|uniref:hypothetical protein n=1 Tax=Photobacterium japonica TaxID=2910235 RepID=UPI003D10484A